MSRIVLKHDRLVGGELRYNHLLGKKFEYSKQDCYAMLMNMFKDNLDIKLTNYARPNKFWLEEDINIYVDNYANEGFQLIDDPNFIDLRPFDVFLIAIPDHNARARTVTNHCAIYLLDNTVIHHRLGTMSSLAPYRGALKNLTTHVIRHKDVPDMRLSNTSTVDLMDHILPHKRELLMRVLDEHRTE